MSDEFEPDRAAEEAAQEASEIPTMDELFRDGIEQDKLDEANKEMLLPSGTYITQPTPEVPFGKQIGHNDAGRLVVSLWGPVISKKPLAVGSAPPTYIKGRIRIRVSPDYVRKEETGKFDYMSQRWTEAVNAYKRSFGEAPSNKGQVVEMLEKYPVALRIGQVGVPTKSRPEPDGEPDNIVWNIQAAPKGTGSAELSDEVPF